MRSGSCRRTRTPRRWRRSSVSFSCSRKTRTALLKLAEVQLASKDYDGAIDTLRQAIALQPDLPEAWTAMAMAYVAAGRPESAIAEGRKYQKEKPDRAVGYAIEGEALGAAEAMAGGRSRVP